MIRPEFNPASAPHAVDNLRFEELVEMIDFICDPDSDEEEAGYYAGLIECTLPGANITDLVFWPHDWFQDDSMKDVDLTPGEMASYLLAWTGKNLPGSEKITLPKIPESKKS